MKKLLVWLIIFMVLIINYKSGLTETFTTDSYYVGDKNLYIFFKYSYQPRVIPLKDILSWEVRVK